MLRGLAKLVAYSTAPKKVFALLHPIKALKWGAALYLGKKVWNKVSGGSERSGSERSQVGSTRTRHAGADATR